ncbi:MAG: response regulator transcription factor [Anaerolineae bacterium]|nr:response regulator transcription factor [Thermoflexales bacterium]MDW8408135.1 response regulator transcription factor [Anaerolineae bacterium]
MTTATILAADDDPKLLETIRRILALEGFYVLTASHGLQAVEIVRSRQPDVIVLDWLMPGLDGLRLIEQLRQADHTPVLMLTARHAVQDRVEALQAGADDYLIKPFAPEELVARVRALLRRAAPSRSDRPLNFSDLTLYPATREGVRNGRSFALTPREFELLRFMLAHPRQVLTRQQILDHVWRDNLDVDDTVIEVYIGYLRAKTEAAGEPRLIHTVRGVGYIVRE